MKFILTSTLLVGACHLSAPVAAAATWKETLLTSFTQTGSGSYPSAPVVLDASGNVYGTTAYGGTGGGGTVFMLAPPAAGKKVWVQTILYSFLTDSIDGQTPDAGVVMDPSGNLYGTTYYGGKYGDGAAFELSPPGPGSKKWTETIIYSFGGSNDGQSPSTGLLIDSAGQLYGTTNYGGLYQDGTVFRLTAPSGSGKTWKETILRSFGKGNDGQGFNGCGLVGDTAGNIYGTTNNGGKSYDGIAFELSPPAAGKTAWTETILYAFSGSNKVAGSVPRTGMAIDASGNLYGTTSEGGKNGWGAVFELTRPAAGKKTWVPSALYPFTNETGNPNPGASVTLNSAGDVFGVYAGADESGAAFELKPPAKGSTHWAESVLYTFSGNQGDGYNPGASLTLNSAGDLFSTTENGGANGVGTVFELAP